MKIIILCGSNHSQINGVPRQLVTINGERVLDRTIRLLREYGANDISITATDPAFDDVDADKIRYIQDDPKVWVNCFYLVNEPVIYIFGDVYFSPDALRTILLTNTNSVEFFASAPPFAVEYFKPWAEPFAFKVFDWGYFHRCIAQVKTYLSEGRFHRDPIAWETWQVIKGTELNRIDYHNYTAINDYTTDIDEPLDIENLERIL